MTWTIVVVTIAFSGGYATRWLTEKLISYFERKEKPWASH